jgi:hypothetical protein
VKYAQDALENVYELWRRPVHIETTLDGCLNVVSFDGTEHSISKGPQISDHEHGV